MNVIVDTSVWSLALRRDAPRETPPERELAELVREGRVLIAGPIRQEILSGVRGADQYKALRDKLRAFPDVRLGVDDYEDAAACFNRCRSKGLQGSNTDFLLCAVALRLDAGILTTDKDFHHYAKILRIKLHRRDPACPPSRLFRISPRVWHKFPAVPRAARAFLCDRGRGDVTGQTLSCLPWRPSTRCRASTLTPRCSATGSSAPVAELSATGPGIRAQGVREATRAV